MMNAKREGDKIHAYVEPVAFPATSLEANVRTNNNLITLEAENVGTLSFYGQGAGMMPTGQSVVQDVIDIRDGVDMGAAVISAGSSSDCKVDNASAVHRYYVRHCRMCEHIEPIIDTFEEKDGVFYCITKPVSVEQMHEIGNRRKSKGYPMFFAGLAE
jgi:homoserine dehydrogenase